MSAVLEPASTDLKLEVLKDQRQRLAPEALNDPKAKREWDRINHEIREREGQLQLEIDVRGEQRRRAEEEERQRLETERKAKEARLTTLQEDHKQKLRAVESHFAEAQTLVADAIESGKAVYQLSADLGFQMHWNVRERIAEELSNTLGDLLPDLGPRLRIGQRRSLVPEGETLRRVPSEPLSTITLIPDPDPSTPFVESVNGVPINGGKAA